MSYKRYPLSQNLFFIFSTLQYPPKMTLRQINQQKDQQRLQNRCNSSQVIPPFTNKGGKQRSSIFQIVLKNPEGVSYNIRFQQTKNGNQSGFLRLQPSQNMPKVNLKFQNAFSHIINAAHGKNTQNTVCEGSTVPHCAQRRQEKHFYEEINSLTALLSAKQKQLSQAKSDFYHYKLQTSLQIQKLNVKLKAFEQIFQSVSPNINDTKEVKTVSQQNAIKIHKIMPTVEQMRKDQIFTLQKNNKEMNMQIETIHEQLRQKNKLINHFTTIISILTNEKAVLKNDKRQLQRDFDTNTLMIKQLKGEIFKFNSQIKRRQHIFEGYRIKHQHEKQQLKEQLSIFKEKYAKLEAEIILLRENEQRHFFKEDQKQQRAIEKMYQ